MAVLQAGASLKRGTFIVVSLLGRGGFGEVYLARQPRMDREVAIKVLSPAVSDDAEVVHRFEREALAAASLLHPNVLPVFDFDYDEEAGTYFLAMQYVPGGRTLKDRMGVQIDVATAALYTRDVASALDAAHARGIVHRDIKPANVLLDGERPILTDFGIAHLGAMTGITAAGLAMGTPAYMSPEQGMAKEVGPRSDQYSLAVMTYEMLAGKLPFTGDSFSLVMQHVKNDPPPLTSLNAEVPEGVALAVTRALAKDPAARFASCGEYAAAIIMEVPGLLTANSGMAAVRTSPSMAPLRSRLQQSGVLPSAASVKPGSAGISAADYLHPSAAGMAPTLASEGLVVEPAPAPAARSPLLLIGGGVAAAVVLGVGVLVASRTMVAPPPEQPTPVVATVVPTAAGGGSIGPATGSVEVRSNTSAGILVNGQSAGRTPRQLDLEPGEYDVTLVAPSFEDATKRIVVKAGDRLSLPVDLLASRNLDVLNVTEQRLGRDPYIDASDLIRLATSTDTFQVNQDVNAIAYLRPKSFGVRDLSYGLTLRWLKGGEQLFQQGPAQQTLEKTWDQTFVRACAPASALDVRGSGEPMTLQMMVDGELLAEFNFKVSGGNIGAAGVSACDETALPRRQV